LGRRQSKLHRQRQPEPSQWRKEGSYFSGEEGEEGSYHSGKEEVASLKKVTAATPMKGRNEEVDETNWKLEMVFPDWNTIPS
jgi:hypothetical protein